MQENKLQPSEYIPLSPHQPKWEKEGDSWLWRTLYCNITIKIVNKDSHRELLIDARNSYTSEVQTITLIPKSVLEDLYRELVDQEINDMKTQLGLLTAKLAQTEADLESSRQTFNGVPVEVDDDDDQTA